MRLHYYTPAVPESYCVGVHNGHGFGSLFARLFSKVAAKTTSIAAKIAAKTATKAATKIAKTAGRKALKVLTTKGADLAKKVAKEAIATAAEVGGQYALQKINSATESALKTQLPPELVHSIADVAKKGLQTVGSKARNVATHSAHTLIDKGVVRAEQVGGIKRKPVRVQRGGAKKKKVRKKEREVLTNIIDSA